MITQTKSSKKNPKRKSIKTMIRHRISAISDRMMKFTSSRIFACILTILVVSVLSFLLVFKWSPSSSVYKVGEVVRGNIKAPYDLEVIDEIATENRMQRRKEKILPRYDIDLALIADISSRIKIAFDTLHEQIVSFQNKILKEKKMKISNVIVGSIFLDEIVHSQQYIKAERSFESKLGGNFPPSLLFFFRDNIFSFSIADSMTAIAKKALPREIVSDRQLYISHLVKGIFVKDIATGEKVKISSSVKPVELRELEKIVLLNIAKVKFQYSKEFQVLLSKQIIKMARPTLSFNSLATQQEQKRVVTTTRKVTKTIKEGEMIVRDGERLNKRQYKVLEKLRDIYSTGNSLHYFLGTMLIILLFFVLCWFAVRRFNLLNYREGKQVVLFVFLVVMNILILKFGVVFALGLQSNFEQFNITAFYNLIPFASISIVSLFLQGRKEAIFLSIINSVLVMLILPTNISYPLMVLASGIVTSSNWKNYTSRTVILFVSLVVGILNVIINSGIFLQQGFYVFVNNWDIILFTFFGGLGNIIIVSALIPILESLFKLTTDMKLLELSDHNHPLLKDMILRAPGTYHHSIMVANLAEEAASKVDANPLLLRAGAFFHDIGKTLKSEYFIENQISENRHDKLTPNMSALILISHVKEGVELARKHKLPNEVIDLISQHHGTSLIRFFYDKALKLKNNGEVRVESFCYPGPRPRTKEAGILMLADMVEASAKTLAEPSPGQLSSLVTRIVQTVIKDSQLEECDLTLSDLGIIQDSFLRVLAGFYHHRLNYPEQTDLKKGMKTNGNSSIKQAKIVENKPEKTPEKR